MFNKNYEYLVKRINELGCRLENHISGEKDILQEIEFECKRILLKFNILLTLCLFHIFASR